MGGTDGHVYIILNGESKSTKEILLTEDKKAFERGQTDSFAIKAEDVGKVG